MDFIQFILIFAASFIAFRYVASFFIGTETTQTTKCTLHSWEYTPDGYMACSKCKKKPLEDD